MIKRLNKVKRPAIPAAIKREILARATDEKGIPRCEKEGCDNIGADLDHIQPFEIVLEHKADNLWLLCKACHKIKTAADLGLIHKTLRLAGERVSTKCKKKIPSRPWGPARPLRSRPKKSSKK